jgi:hypothetical protein
MSSIAKKEVQSGCRLDNEGLGLESALTQEVKLQIACMLYRAIVGQYPDRLVMLCDRERMLARSDRPETMPLLF